MQSPDTYIHIAVRVKEEAKVKMSYNTTQSNNTTRQASNIEMAYLITEQI